ncbi:Vesicle-associated membrane protein [Histomonas meleagridis]|uniref:Vesicle-associated membrane protein n=1 Tax=Histomonas meleagridis TaxID=135588 RepID=UPI003559C868|nr:Vesicle-associated membrane protein [Histomonas meleagridis]KAH0799409.1 Vesicle-associated membrane protein [Histomonas meleagridis]
MELISYTAVARGGIILATHSTDGSDFERDIQKLLESPFVRNEQRRMNHFIFSFYKGASLSFICVSPAEVNRQIPLKYLEILSNKWNLIIGDKGNTAGPHSLTNQAREIFEKSIIQATETISKTEKIKKDLDHTQKIITDSLHMALERGDDLQHLSTHTEDLLATSEDFMNQANNLKNKMRCARIKSVIIKIVLLIVVAYILISFFCGGLRLKKCLK